jgi:hypothetical protein
MYEGKYESFLEALRKANAYITDIFENSVLVRTQLH